MPLDQHWRSSDSVYTYWDERAFCIYTAVVIHYNLLYTK
jgi:hypothetical protein